MKLELKEITPIKNAIDVVADIANEGILEVKKDYIEIVATDPGLVFMSILKIMKSTFYHYEITKDEVLPINLKYFKQILSKLKNETLTIEKTNDNKLKLEITNTNKKTFLLPLLNVEETNKKVPDLHFKVLVTLKSKDFKNAIEDASITSDTITFIVNDNSFLIESKGDLLSCKTELSNVLINTNEPNTYKSNYGIAYLLKMIKASKLSPEVSIRFDNDFPLKLEYYIPNVLSLSFLLAPRIP